MNKTKLALILIFTAALSAVGHSQSTLAGRVVEVVDGKTVVLDISNRRLTAVIQYIEVPEPQQPLSGTVREHLAKLVLGKDVVLRSAGFTTGKSLGRLYVNSADVAVQMLRDGAAWHIAPEKSGQDAAEGEDYASQQNQARLEGRGVWGVKDMKPAWQFRAEKEEKERQERVAAEYAAAHAGEAKYEPAAAVKAPAKRGGPWSDINPSLKNPGPIMHGYNAASKTGYLGTSLMGVKELESMPTGQQTACDVTYVYKQETEKKRTGKFYFTLVSVADEWRFAKTNDVKVVVDEKTVIVGKPKRTAAKENEKAVEKLTYEVNKATIEKIVYGGDVVIQVGNYSLFPQAGLQLLLYNMLQAAN